MFPCPSALAAFPAFWPPDGSTDVTLAELTFFE